MTVTNILKDAESLTMTINATFDAPVERVWQVWNDPRQLERWWGPPTYPATVVDHDFSPGGTVTYYMTGPEGDRPHGWWLVVAVDDPHHLQFEDGFADGDGRPDPSLPTTNCTVHLAPRDGGGTDMQVVTTFASLKAMEQLVAMGMEEGMRAAMGQIDALLHA